MDQEQNDVTPVTAQAEQDRAALEEMLVYGERLCRYLSTTLRMTSTAIQREQNALAPYNPTAGETLVCRLPQHTCNLFMVAGAAGRVTASREALIFPTEIEEMKRVGRWRFYQKLLTELSWVAVRIETEFEMHMLNKPIGIRRTEQDWDPNTDPPESKQYQRGEIWVVSAVNRPRVLTDFLPSGGD